VRLGANRRRHRLGRAAAASDDAHLYRDLWQPCQDTIRQLAIRRICDGGAGAVELLYRSTYAGERQPGRQRTSDLESVFPRLIIPIAGVMGGLLDMALVTVLLFALMFYYGLVPTLAALTLPLFILMAIAPALGVSLWLSALNLWCREVNYVVPFIAQF
jgi:hypothetical protein